MLHSCIEIAGEKKKEDGLLRTERGQAARIGNDDLEGTIDWTRSEYAYMSVTESKAAIVSIQLILLYQMLAMATPHPSDCERLRRCL